MAMCFSLPNPKSEQLHINGLEQYHSNSIDNCSNSFANVAVVLH